MPTAWGLPSAELEESSCIANGDDYCSYSIRWHEQPRWLPILVGAALAGALGWVIRSQVDVANYFVVTLGLLGGSLGLAAELWRTQMANTRFSQETNDSLREMARQTVEAMDEVRALQQRQDEWSRLLEEQVTERTVALQRMLDGLQRLDQRRDTTLRVVSHDLKNPLTAVKLQLTLLADPTLDGAERADLVADTTEALEKVERLVQDLSKLAQSGSQAALVDLVPTKVNLAKLADRLRRSLRAMVWGQKIRTSVFCTPEAPAEFETDNVLFDRVVDNLLANAAKCTLQGSILVELAGSPGMVTVKVSDTGPGISDERIEKVFRVGETSFAESGRGWGLGLPIVVRLLDQIGGRLEVMSLPGKGTTFWAHFPSTLPERSRPLSEPPMEEAIDRVVTIRRVK